MNESVALPVPCETVMVIGLVDQSALGVEVEASKGVRGARRRA